MDFTKYIYSGILNPYLLTYINARYLDNKNIRLDNEPKRTLFWHLFFNTEKIL